MPTAADLLDRPDGTITVTLPPATTAYTLQAGQTRARVTVTDNEGDAMLAIADATAPESAALVFTVTLQPPSGSQLTVAYSTVDGTAAAPGDYLAATGSLTFAPGTSSRQLTITVHDDALAEQDETLTVQLSNARAAGRAIMLSRAQATGTLVDNDFIALTMHPGPAIGQFRGRAGVTEGAPAVFVINASSAPATPLPITLAVTGATGFAGGARPTSLTMPGGQSQPDLHHRHHR